MEIVEQVNSFDEIPKIWREAKIKQEDTLYSSRGDWDTRCITFERNLSAHEQRVNYLWGVLAFVFTLGNIFKFEKIEHLLHDTTETKVFDIVLKGHIQGKIVHG